MGWSNLVWTAGEKLWKSCNNTSHKCFIKGLQSLDLDEHQARGRVMNRSEDRRRCISLWWKTSCLALSPFLRSVIMRFACFLRSIGHAKRTSQSWDDCYRTVQVVYRTSRCFPDHKYTSAKPQSEGRGEKKGLEMGGTGQCWWRFTEDSIWGEWWCSLWYLF